MHLGRDSREPSKIKKQKGNLGARRRTAVEGTLENARRWCVGCNGTRGRSGRQPRIERMFTCFDRQEMMVLTDGAAIVGLLAVDVRRHRDPHEQNNDG
jgi:hypothetical protein